MTLDDARLAELCRRYSGLSPDAYAPDHPVSHTVELLAEVRRLRAARSEDHATFAQQLREVDAEVAELNAQLKSALVAATGLSNRVVKAEADNERLRKILRGRGLV